jgi:hypothetical protein
MDHDVEAELQRPLVVGGGEGVVGDRQQAVLLGDPRQPL